MSASGGQQGAGQHGRRQVAEHPHRALLPVEEVQDLETWREPIAREVEIGPPSSIRGRARSDRSDTALRSIDCLHKHATAPMVKGVGAG